jgi:HK97 family phage prohead protease
VIEIYDIDGTLTLPSSEEPRVALIEYIRDDVKNEGTKIFIVTGRAVKRRAETEKWLDDNGVPYDALFLQDFSEDSNPAVIEAFKAYKYSKLLEQYPGEIAYLVDDDAEARDAAEGMGITAYTAEQLLAKEGRAIDPDGYLPTEEMKAEAERGLEWRREFGRGGTEIGVARARDISNGRRLPYATVVRIASYLARHEVDKEAQGFSAGEDGYPSAGRSAWALWGGDAAKVWSSRIINEAAAEDAARSEGDEMGIEFRTATAELRAVDPEGFTFEGMAAVYDSPSADGTTPEVVKPGAFARSLAAAQRGEWDIKAYADHNPERLLGTTKTGTLELEDTAEGLRARVKLNPNVSFHRDLAEIVRTMGKSLGLSFGFFSTNANRINDEGVRELREVKLVEVSALTGLSPYYPSTISTVSVRSLASEAGLEIEPLRAAVSALLAGEVSEDQAKILADAIAAVIAEDDAEMAEDVTDEEVVSEETVIEEVPAEESAPRAVPRAIREKQIELAKRALK